MVILCPVDEVELTVPAEWDHDIAMDGVPIHAARDMAFCWVLFHIRKEHGIDALVETVKRFKALDR